jgi:hypothetical protein
MDCLSIWPNLTINMVSQTQQNQTQQNFTDPWIGRPNLALDMVSQTQQNSINPWIGQAIGLT